ncbi:MAG: hypothetical protein RIR70_326 [Pseudomonadota bacterium]
MKVLGRNLVVCADPPTACPAFASRCECKFIR